MGPPALPLGYTASYYILDKGLSHSTTNTITPNPPANAAS